MKTQAAVLWLVLLCTPVSHLEDPASTQEPEIGYFDRVFMLFRLTPVKRSSVGLP